MCGIWSPSNAWFLGPTRVHIQNDISIGSVVLQDSLTVVADRQTDRYTDHATPSVAIIISYSIFHLGELPKWKILCWIAYRVAVDRVSPPKQRTCNFPALGEKLSPKSQIPLR